MRTQSINIAPRAYAALLSSCAKMVLAQDAPPLRMSDIEPMLKGGFRRHEIERALASKLKGKLAADQASPDDVARKLVGMLEPEKETTMNASKDHSPMRRRTARDGLDAELQRTLRSKVSGAEFDAIMAAIGGGSSGNDEPSKESEYDQEQFGSPSNRDKTPYLEDASDNSAVAKPGEFAAKDSNGDLAGKIMDFVSPHLTDADRGGLQSLLDKLLGDEDDDTAEDDPPAFSGQPLVSGKLRPLSAKCDTAQDAKVVRYASKVRDEARKSFDARFPDAARIAGEAPVVYSDGTVVKDSRLLGGSTPTPRRAAAMDSASSLRSSRSFAERFPNAARIRSV